MRCGVVVFEFVYFYFSYATGVGGVKRFSGIGMYILGSGAPRIYCVRTSVELVEHTEKYPEVIEL